jgi:thiol-disulfide isomerase/thioredoxin
MSGMVKRSHVVLVILLLIVLLAGWYTYTTVQKNRGLSASSDAARSFNTSVTQSLTNLSGDVVTVEDYFGEVMVINTWASWSPLSQEQLRQLSELAEEYENQPITFLAINRSEPSSTAEAYLSTVSISSDLEIVLDQEDSYYQAIEGYAMPVTIIYDRDGTIVFEANGNFSQSELKQIIDEQLSL